MRRCLPLLLITLLVPPALIVQPGPAKGINERLRKDLADRVKEDQDAHFAWMGDKTRGAELAKKVEENDKRNTTWLKAVIEKHGWPGKSLVGDKTLPTVSDKMY